MLVTANKISDLLPIAKTEAMGRVFYCRLKACTLIISVIFIDVKLLSVFFLDLCKLHKVGVFFLAKRETVQVDVTAVVGAIKGNSWSASTLCRKMGRSVTWISEWKKTPPKNLPSPEEATRMCAILGVEPSDILIEQSDIDKVESLIERERPKKSQKTSALLPEMKTPSALDGAEDVERWKREIIGSLDDLPPDMIEFLAGQIATIKSRREK